MWCTVEIEHHCRNFDDMWESDKETHLLCCSSTQNFPFNDFNICFFSTAATQSVTGCCYQVCSLLQNKESSSCLILMLDNLVLSIIKKAALKPPQMAAVCRQRDEINNYSGNLHLYETFLKMYGALT